MVSGALQNRRCGRRPCAHSTPRCIRSPDGHHEHIAFVRHGDLWVLNTTSGEQQRLTYVLDPEQDDSYDEEDEDEEEEDFANSTHTNGTAIAERNLDDETLNSTEAPAKSSCSCAQSSSGTAAETPASPSSGGSASAPNNTVAANNATAQRIPTPEELWTDDQQRQHCVIQVRARNARQSSAAHDHTMLLVSRCTTARRPRCGTFHSWRRSPTTPWSTAGDCGRLVRSNIGLTCSNDRLKAVDSMARQFKVAIATWAACSCCSCVTHELCTRFIRTTRRTALSHRRRPKCPSMPVHARDRQLELVDARSDCPSSGVIVSVFIEEEGGHLLIRTFPGRRHLFATLFPWFERRHVHTCTHWFSLASASRSQRPTDTDLPVWPWAVLQNVAEQLDCKSHLTTQTPLLADTSINWTRVDATGLVAGNSACAVALCSDA